MSKLNCWEHLGCHFEGCPAHSERRLNGIHGGLNAGRACWVVAGTRCGGEVQGEFAQKSGNCMKCEFYLKVVSEEGAMNIISGFRLLEKLKQG